MQTNKEVNQNIGKLKMLITVGRNECYQNQLSSLFDVYFFKHLGFIETTQIYMHSKVL